MTVIADIIESNKDKVFIGVDEFVFKQGNMRLEVDLQVGILTCVNIPSLAVLSLATSVGARAILDGVTYFPEEVLAFSIEPSSFLEDADFTHFNFVMFGEHSKKHLFFK